MNQNQNDDITKCDKCDIFLIQEELELHNVSFYKIFGLWMIRYGLVTVKNIIVGFHPLSNTQTKHPKNQKNKKLYFWYLNSF